MNKLLLGAFLASIFLSLTACSEENPEQGTNPPAEQPGDSTDPGIREMIHYQNIQLRTVRQSQLFPVPKGQENLLPVEPGDSVHSNLSQRRWFRRDSSLGDREIG